MTWCPSFSGKTCRMCRLVRLSSTARMRSLLREWFMGGSEGEPVGAAAPPDRCRGAAGLGWRSAGRALASRRISQVVVQWPVGSVRVKVAPPGVVLGDNPTTVGMNDLAGNGQAEARSAGAGLGRAALHNFFRRCPSSSAGMPTPPSQKAIDRAGRRARSEVRRPTREFGVADHDGDHAAVGEY